MTEFSLAKLKAGIPCGTVLGHGQYCSDGYLCEACQKRLDAAAEIERLTEQRGPKP